MKVWIYVCKKKSQNIILILYKRNSNVHKFNDESFFMKSIMSGYFL